MYITQRSLTRRIRAGGTEYSYSNPDIKEALFESPIVIEDYNTYNKFGGRRVPVQNYKLQIGEKIITLDESGKTTILPIFAFKRIIHHKVSIK